MPWPPDDRSVTERLGLRKPSPLPRHVWIDGDRPGLLLEWQRRDGWWGRVVMVEPEGPEVAWLRADRLKPV